MGEYTRFDFPLVFFPDKNEVDTALLEPFFVDYSPDKWVEEPEEAYIEYVEDDVSFGCRIGHCVGLGFSILFWQSDLSSRSGEAWWTVNDKSKEYYFVDIESDSMRSVATFVSPLDAWSYLKHFLSNPTEMPPSLDLESNLVFRDQIPVHPLYGGPPLPEGIANCYRIDSVNQSLIPMVLQE